MFLKACAKVVVNIVSSLNVHFTLITEVVSLRLVFDTLKLHDDIVRLATRVGRPLSQPWSVMFLSYFVS